MALLNKVYKQRTIGVFVLVALAVIFLPMLFSRKDEQRQVQVNAPTAPQMTVMSPVQVESVNVPEPQVIPEKQMVVVRPVRVPTLVSSVAAKRVAVALKLPAATRTQKVAQAPDKLDTTQKYIDLNGFPVSWSVQIVSLSNRANAYSLKNTLLSQGYNAYVRSADEMSRVFIGPIFGRAKADRLRDLLSKQLNLKGFVVPFHPERS